MEVQSDQFRSKQTKVLNLRISFMDSFSCTPGCLAAPFCQAIKACLSSSETATEMTESPVKANESNASSEPGCPI